MYTSKFASWHNLTPAGRLSVRVALAAFRTVKSCRMEVDMSLVNLLDYVCSRVPMQKF